MNINIGQRVIHKVDMKEGTVVEVDKVCFDLWQYSSFYALQVVSNI